MSPTLSQHHHHKQHPTTTVISPFLKVPSLFAVGLVGSLLGYGTTHALASARARLSPACREASAKKKKQQHGMGAGKEDDSSCHGKDIPVLKTSLAVGVYLAVSTNLRYQLVSGVVEERLIAPWLARSKAAGNLASIAVRSCNTYVGSAMMIDFLKLLVRCLSACLPACLPASLPALPPCLPACLARSVGLVDSIDGGGIFPD